MRGYLGNQGAGNRPQQRPRDTVAAAAVAVVAAARGDRDGNRDPNYRPATTAAGHDEQPPDDAFDGRRRPRSSARRSCATKQLDEPDGAQGQADPRAGQDGRDAWGSRAWPARASRTSSSRILKAHARNGENIYGDGVLEILQDGFGFLRSSDGSLPRRPGRHLRQPEPDPPLQPAHRRFDLRPDPSAEGRRALFRAAEGRRDQFRFARSSSRNKVLFENLTPFHPDQAAQAAARQRHRPKISPRAPSTWSRRSARASAA